MQTLPIYLLMDNSSSMKKDGKLESAQEALKYSIDAMRGQALLTNTQCLVRMIVFNSNIETHPFQMLDDFEPPTLRAGGSTNMVEALGQVLTDLDDDLKDQAYFFDPLIIFITDGLHCDPYSMESDEDQIMNFLEEEFLLHSQAKKAIRVPIAIGESVDHEALALFASDGVSVLYANNSEDLVNFVSWTRNAIGSGLAGLLEAPKPESSSTKQW